MKSEKKEERPEWWGELPGYDPNVARNNAMEHARRSFPEIRERRRYPLV